MIELTFEDIIREKCPNLCVATIECEIRNTEFSENLWEDIELFEEEFYQSYRLEDINKRIPIRATREAYKALGKDPNRYRPSAESLCRRVLRRLSLYKINTLVDLINLVSLKTGYSIGGFDANQIIGNLRLGVGKEGELFQAIGRGELNIAGLPVYRDQIGGIGTPTSDEERTKISLSTNRLLMIINAYSGKKGLEEAVDLSINLLNKYAFVERNKDFQIKMY